MEKTIVLSDSFFDSYNLLAMSEKKIVSGSLKQLATSDKGKGFQLHGLYKTNCDDSFRSARLTQDLRVILSQQGDKYILLHIGHHDKAYAWAESKYIKVSNFGALSVYDHNIAIAVKETASRDFAGPFDATRASLLKLQGVTVKDLVRLGVDEHHAETLMHVADEETFLKAITVYTEEIQEGLLDIITGTKTVTQVYAELTDPDAGEQATPEQALQHKDSRRRFYLVENVDDLERILEMCFEKWKLFLHPEQEKLVRLKSSGPVLIEGGPGTGKTVVGIHRAAYLADKVYRAEDGCKILFCTFSKKLAGYIDEKVRQLLAQRGIQSNIEVKGVDQLIYRLIARHQLASLASDSDQKRKELYQEIYSRHDFAEPLSFFVTEYEEVVQKYQITSLDQYQQRSRAGLSIPLNSDQRQKYWPFFQDLLEAKKTLGLIDYEDRAFILHQALQSGRVPPEYDAVIVDEAQDLSPIKLKVLAGLVKSQHDGLMLLSDQNQRIFKLRSWKADVELPVRGRTHHLYVNYRTTKQIRDFADKQFFRIQQPESQMRQYKSLFHGPEPDIRHFEDAGSQYRFVTSRLKALLSDGVKPEEICIITPTENEIIAGILSYEEIPRSIYVGETYPAPGSGVGIGKLQGCKGLEFRVVFLANFEKAGASTEADDFYSDDRQRQTECLKYVAATRAREELIVTLVS